MLICKCYEKFSLQAISHYVNETWKETYEPNTWEYQTKVHNYASQKTMRALPHAFLIIFVIGDVYGYQPFQRISAQIHLFISLLNEANLHDGVMCQGYYSSRQLSSQFVALCGWYIKGISDIKYAINCVKAHCCHESNRYNI